MELITTILTYVVGTAFIWFPYVLFGMFITTGWLCTIDSYKGYASNKLDHFPNSKLWIACLILFWPVGWIIARFIVNQNLEINKQLVDECDKNTFSVSEYYKLMGFEPGRPISDYEKKHSKKFNKKVSKKHTKKRNNK